MISLPKLKRSFFLGLLYTFMSSVFITLSCVIVKKIQHIDPVQLAFVRCISVVVICLPIAIYSNVDLFSPAKYRTLFLLHAFSSATAIYLQVLTYNLLPLADASVILASTPAVVMLSSRIFLKEACGIVQISALVLTTVGVILSTHVPAMLINRDQVSHGSTYVWGLAAAFGRVIFNTTTFLCVRKMKDVQFSVVTLHAGLLGVVEFAGLAGIDGCYSLPRCGLDSLLMMSMGVLGCLGHCLVNVATQKVAAGVASVLRAALDILTAMICQLIFFDLLPDMYSVSGGILVTIAIATIGLKNCDLCISARKYRL